MKKSICIILSALLIVCSFAACGKKDSLPDKDSTKVNDEGKIYVELDETDENGVPKTSILSDKEIEKLDKETTDKDSDKSSTTKKANGTTAGSNSNTSDEDFSEPEMTAKPEDLLPTGKDTTNTEKAKLRDSVIGSVVKKGKFTISANIISGDSKTPTTIAMSDNKLAMDISVSGIVMRVLLMDDKMYCVMPSVKYYFELGEGEYGELGSIGDITAQQTYVKTTTVKDGSTTLTCEEYKTDTGSTNKFYFDSKNNWTRWEIIDGTGDSQQIVIFEISSFSGKVDSSLFNLSGYTKQDLSALAGTSSSTKKSA